MGAFDDVDRERLARDIAAAALLRGDFVLSSGARSDYYLDKYLFATKPDILRRVSILLAAMVPPDVDRLAGPELGAVAIAAGVSLELGTPFVIVRRQGKEYGTARLVEGELQPGENVLVLEDVVSSGAQAISAAERLQESGVSVVGILAVIDREQGGSQNIEERGYRFSALFTRTDLGIEAS